jgi:hypothetical protein
LPVYTSRDLTMVEDRDAPGDWRLQYFDDDGTGYVLRSRPIPAV